MTAFAQAVERQQWELVALYLLAAVADTAASLPPETLTALIDVLSDEQTRPEETGDDR